MIIVWLNNHKVFVYQLLDVASVYGTRQGWLKANTDKYRHWWKMECCCPKIYRKFFDAKKNTSCIWKSRDENTGKRNGFSSMWAICYTSWLKNYISKFIILYTIMCSKCQNDSYLRLQRHQFQNNRNIWQRSTMFVNLLFIYYVINV